MKKQRRCAMLLLTVLLLSAMVAGAAVPYTVVDTGQTTTYNNLTAIQSPAAGAAFAGQDAQHDGAQPDYTRSADGLTVLDNNTGLTWQQTPDTDGNGVINASDKMNWTQLQAYPATLNAANYGGYSDWWLPTIKELYSLILFTGVDPSGYEESDISGMMPFIDTDYFAFAYGDTSAGERIIDAQFASCTLYQNGGVGEALLFGVNFADGRIKGYGLTLYGQDKTFNVLCCRGNTEYGVNNFSSNGDGTVTDQATGLMWQQADSGSGMTWQEALAYAENLELGGHSDWRLPNAKELQSILDYSRSPDLTGSAAIDEVFTASSFINEAGEVDYPFYWSSTTHANWTDDPGRTAAYLAFGRGLGYMNGSWLDVHGAGAQRSDPKTGDPADYPTGNGPQGDAIRIYNHVRCVRDTSDAPSGSGSTLTSGGAMTSLRDFDGDGKTDIGCYYAPDGWWYVYKSAASNLWVEQYGYGDTYAIAADFDGDGLCDHGTYAPESGAWNIMRSSAGEWTTQFGYSGTVPVTGDFDGDGKMDFGCYYAPEGNWYIFKSSAEELWTTRFGYSGTVPVVGDFDGDDVDDFGCYYARNGSWYMFMSESQQLWTTRFGYAGTQPIVGDFDGDGMDDFGCYHASGGHWYIYKSTTKDLWTTAFGYQGTSPIVGDYDGDSIYDFGCYYPSTGHWYVYLSKSRDLWVTQFGYEGTASF